MVGERDVVEIIFEVVDVERGPAAIAALHALDPLAAARDRGIVFVAAGLPPRAIHRHDHDGGVVEIGIMGIVVLERPAARPHVGAFHGPVALEVQHLPRLQPVERLLGFGSDSAPPASISAWQVSAVSHTGETQGWQ